MLLCADKNDAVVKITLPQDNKTIIASKYQSYLPTEQQLTDEVKKEMEKLDNEENNIRCPVEVSKTGFTKYVVRG
ncbi:MAG: hypothetical protein M0Q26_15210 [Chitinophagaceae bacterium]|nr:hypothetical protein [Chitinophagaceae bacterium]